ncbi:hypothetical protein LX15_000864 [Streptoalloteichus tenebrarius]|uniref:Uncharacterized protein n=1 Tax=Streptoalloteichus tenebrarius (strain ATCC 17920 / DSM 40477 / JCM 4838 / CBS 697.72 / NBRC 16177 / NCIMB 11028 / NRRL B-12390 / A12253. 1 / ISP 5477) TaxID=1933 RepID=A0ABT1HNT7_STRSD|nr:hypothetical protein [Streptoalloteichus tenebrarius]MCP2257179.1 hypothetical protein [Streptoalloteichus tenebrarius]BFE98813.1 hypothetical protein GCM10020241_04890 [Streptoalloteichus tenebrarius]
MPLHIENLTSRVHLDAGTRWTKAQLDELVDLVSARLARDQREAARLAEETALRRDAMPSDPIAR